MQPGPAKEPTVNEREQRVAEIARRVAAGTYTVDAEELSRAIVRKHIKRVKPEHRNLPGRK